ncbi:MAG: hypothetical protein KAR33_07235 [Candidatus Thorarchaeota archaeon]|nr:hypothetical protein [Candidatus Thorarchaeota archaeon]
MATSQRYHPVPSSAPPFAHEFVKRMRNTQEVRAKPSVRQTQAIPQFLSARFFRNGDLSLDDFVEAAVYTSYPPDQDIARLIAEEILIGRTKEAPVQVQVKAKVVKEDKKDPLAEVMAQIRREQELAKKIKKDKVQAGFDYLQELRKRKNKDLYDAAMDYLKEGDVVLRGVTSDEELKKEASSELLDRLGGLTANDILNSQTLDVLDDVAQSTSSAEQLASKALRGDSDVEKEFESLADRDPSTAAKALSLMEQMGNLDKDMLSKMDQTLQDSLRDLSEMTDYAAQLGRMPDNGEDMIQKAPEKFALSHAMEFAATMKQHTGKDISEQLMDEYDQQYDNGGRKNVDTRQLAESSMSTSSWNNLVNKDTQDTIDDAKSRSSPSDYLRQKHREASTLQDHLKHTKTREEWRKKLQQLADAAVQTSPTKTHLRQTARDLGSQGTIPSPGAVREAGERLGMTEPEILELLNPSFQVIKRLIQAGVDDFDRLHSLMSSAGLSKSQLSELADISDDLDNEAALGAVAHQDLMAALGSGGQSGQSGISSATDMARAEKVMGGLLGGPATNVIRIWYTYRDQIPPELRKRLKDIARRLLIDLGQRFAKATMGSSMLGGLQQSTTVRPFRIGDDIDLIDLEETMDSLLSMGQSNFDALNADDFLVTETYQGHRAFFWALDKSGSMHAPEKLGMLSISVMAGLYGIQKDDFGVVLFDNETHIVKEIPDRSVSVDKVAADLLEVRAGGGTGGSSSMRLAIRNFEDTRAKEKIFIFSTDAYLFDQKQCEELAVEMQHHDIQMIILVPKHQYDRRAAEKLAKLSHGVVLDIATIEELPERLLRMTNY